MRRIPHKVIKIALQQVMPMLRQLYKQFRQLQLTDRLTTTHL